jgi:hypothetical protein
VDHLLARRSSVGGGGPDRRVAAKIVVVEHGKGSGVKRYVVALRPEAEDASRVEIEAASQHEAEARVAERWHPDEVLWMVERIEPVEYLNDAR